MVLDNKLILSKTSIFESVNRTFFTSSSFAIALFVSTQTELYNNDYNRYFIRFISLSILLLNIIYCYLNVNDYSVFIRKIIIDETYINKYTKFNIYILYLYLIILLIFMLFNLYINFK
tara:strand:- start:1252 stop:1605 length:354 start_codon:yes stop_codon:yes gene_type:complete